jgi:hypothetical protein
LNASRQQPHNDEVKLHHLLNYLLLLRKNK